jgi:transaldolase
MIHREFDSYGATVRTLRSFISSYYELLSFVREFMLPDPDKK